MHDNYDGNVKPEGIATAAQHHHRQSVVKLLLIVILILNLETVPSSAAVD